MQLQILYLHNMMLCMTPLVIEIKMTNKNDEMTGCGLSFFSIITLTG